jgi:hypothetical protein
LPTSALEGNEYLFARYATPICWPHDEKVEIHAARIPALVIEISEITLDDGERCLSTYFKLVKKHVRFTYAIPTPTSTKKIDKSAQRDAFFPNITSSSMYVHGTIKSFAICM